MESETSKTSKNGIVVKMQISPNQYLILLVSSNENTWSDFRNGLSCIHSGYSFLHAHSLQKAYAILEHSRNDICAVCAEYQGITSLGTKVIKRIRADNNNLPYYFFSQPNVDLLAQNLADLGANGSFSFANLDESTKNIHLAITSSFLLLKKLQQQEKLNFKLQTTNFILNGITKTNNLTGNNAYLLISRIAKTIHADRTWLFEIDQLKNTDYLHCVYERCGKNQAGIFSNYHDVYLQASEHFMGLVSGKQSQYIPNIDLIDLDSATLDLYKSLQIGSIISHRIEISNAPPSLIILQKSTHSAPWNEDVFDYFKELSKYLSFAFENDLINSRFKTNYTDLAKVFEVSKIAMADYDLYDVLQNILVKIITIMEAQNGGGIYLLQPDNSTLELVASYLLPEELISKIQTVSTEDTFSGKAIKTMAPVILSDISNAENLQASLSPIVKRLQHRNFISVPIIRSDNTAIGTINLSHSGQKRFTQDDINLLGLMANELADAIDKAKHIEKLREANLKISREIKIAREQAEKRDNFVYSVSHDLKQPLTAIKGYSEVLIHKAAHLPAGKSQQMIKNVFHNACSMHRMLDDLTAYSQTDAAALEKDLFCPAIVLKYISSILMKKTDSGNVTLDFHHIDGAEIYYNQSQFTQIMQNLVTNAIKHNQQIENLVITIGYDQNDTQSNKGTFFVRDNGGGIATDDLGNIFNLFQRGHEGDMIPGSGLGLAIVKKIIENNRGRIWVESVLKEGTTFYFTVAHPDKNHTKEQ